MCAICHRHAAKARRRTHPVLCVILQHPENSLENQLGRPFCKRCGSGGRSLGVGVRILCITSAPEQHSGGLSSLGHAVARRSGGDGAHFVDENGHQRRVGVGRDAVAEIGDVTPPRIEAGQRGADLAPERGLIGRQQQGVEVAL